MAMSVQPKTAASRAAAVKPNVPDAGQGHQGAGELDERVRAGNGTLAVGAAAAEQEEAQQRNVVEYLDFLVAGRAGRWRPPQVPRRRLPVGGGLFWLIGQEAGALLSPPALQHGGQAVDRHIEEAADGGAEGGGEEIEEKNVG